MKSDFLIAVTQLASERNLPREVVISAIEAALVSVYKREGETAGQNLSVKILPTTGEVKVAALKTVVEEVTDTDLEITSYRGGQAQEGRGHWRGHRDRVDGPIRWQDRCPDGQTGRHAAPAGSRA